MKVTSPVGQYQYRVERVRLERGRVLVDGSMGVWETTMEIEPADLAALARRALPGLAAASLVLVARGYRRRSR